MHFASLAFSDTIVLPVKILGTLSLGPGPSTYPDGVEGVVIDGGRGRGRIRPHVRVQGHEDAPSVGAAFLHAHVHALALVSLEQLPLAARSVHVHPGRPERRQEAWRGKGAG